MKKRLGFALALALLRCEPAFTSAALTEGSIDVATNDGRDASAGDAIQSCRIILDRVRDLPTGQMPHVRVGMHVVEWHGKSVWGISRNNGEELVPQGRHMRSGLMGIGTSPVKPLLPLPASTPEPVSYYQGIYDTEYQNSKAVLDSMAASGDAETYYTFQYALGGTLSLYEATRDVKYLERALAWAETMVSKAAIMDSNGNRNWSGAGLSPYARAPIAHQLHDLQGSTELGRLARISLTDPVLKRRYGSRATVIYDFLRDHILNKHLFTRSGLSWFQNDVVQLRRAMNDKTALLLRVLTSVYLSSAALGGADNATYKYLEILTELAKGFKARLEPYQDGLIWDRRLGYAGPVPPNDPSTLMDTSHANRFPYALVDLHWAGIVFAREDVRGVSVLLTRTIWNRSLTDPRFTNFIDGANYPASGRPAWGLGNIYHGWVVLAEYDPQVRLVADAVLKAILAGTSNPSLDHMNTLHGRIALSGHLAKAVWRYIRKVCK